jgi:hypothetical protein
MRDTSGRFLRQIYRYFLLERLLNSYFSPFSPYLETSFKELTLFLNLMLNLNHHHLRTLKTSAQFTELPIDLLTAESTSIPDPASGSAGGGLADDPWLAGLLVFQFGCDLSSCSKVGVCSVGVAVEPVSDVCASIEACPTSTGSDLAGFSAMLGSMRA